MTSTTLQSIYLESTQLPKASYKIILAWLRHKKLVQARIILIGCCMSMRSSEVAVRTMAHQEDSQVGYLTRARRCLLLNKHAAVVALKGA